MSILETSLYPVFLDFVYLSFLRHRTFLYPSLLACTRSFLTHALSLCLHHNNNKSDLVHRAGLDFEIAFARILCRWMHHILSDSVVHTLSSVCLEYLIRQDNPSYKLLFLIIQIQPIILKIPSTILE